MDLRLRFSAADRVHVGLDDDETDGASFEPPLSDRDDHDLRWYLETYGAHSLGDPDDDEAARVVANLPRIGAGLFRSIFTDDTARRLFDRFLLDQSATKRLTIAASQPAILGLPWELMGDPTGRFRYLSADRPAISIRRTIPGVGQGRPVLVPTRKNRLHLLFVVSRPDDVGFLDPRADPLAVMEAIEREAPERISFEFLRPATLEGLVRRLDDEDLPAVDILHFDGHGVFDAHGGLPQRVAARQVALQELLGDDMVRARAGGAAGLLPMESRPEVGYLVFEAEDGLATLVSAEELGESLQRVNVPLVVLSACQTAMLGTGIDPYGTVAAGLLDAGIPAVIAMSHSILVPTTRRLFGPFYAALARGRRVGEALDTARRGLRMDPRRYEVQRGPERRWLSLQDWFVPTLYRVGPGGPLLTHRRSRPSATQTSLVRSSIPAAPEAGFVGRRAELWNIESWFTAGTRRITISGFGGQGKTALAQEAARWLLRTGMFRAAVFIDYSVSQSLDAVSAAVNEIARVLEETLLDAQAATRALAASPTLVVLDNLEVLAPQSLAELLDVARAWSEAGAGRVLLTTRSDLHHSGYAVAGTRVHRRIRLDGCGTRQDPDDALEWFARLMLQPPGPAIEPPSREALVDLFDDVQFHPLSIRILVEQLKTRPAAELGPRLKQLVTDRRERPSADSSDATVPELVASLALSLDRLDEEARQLLPRLGVFRGGAFEDDLLAVTGLGDPSGERQRLKAAIAGLAAGDSRALLDLGEVRDSDGTRLAPDELDALVRDELGPIITQLQGRVAALPAEVPGAMSWRALREQLQAAALLHAESLAGVRPPYLRFHPTLAPMLWEQLAQAERYRLTEAHRQRYFSLANLLFVEDLKRPHLARAILRRDLANILAALDAAFAAGDPDAIDFADSVTHFLGYLGLSRELERVRRVSEAVAYEDGSEAWFTQKEALAERLSETGHTEEAIEVLTAILGAPAVAPSRRARILAQLGRVRDQAGRPDLAVVDLGAAIAILDSLEPSYVDNHNRGGAHADFGDALARLGRFDAARDHYQESLTVGKALGDVRMQGVAQAELGMLALHERAFEDALERYVDARDLFHQLGESFSEGAAWHQLGIIYQERGGKENLEEAERHLREAARLKESVDAIVGPGGAAETWAQLAIVCKKLDRDAAAEDWNRTALAAFETANDRLHAATVMNNLAVVIKGQPGRLAEARALAERALELKKAVDPGAAEIWSTYQVLALIADREADQATDERAAAFRAEAREHRRDARATRFGYPATRRQLRPHAPLIAATIAAVSDSKRLESLEERLRVSEAHGWATLVTAIRQILANERNADALCERLDAEDSMIVEAILAGIADYGSLADILEPTAG